MISKQIHIIHWSIILLHHSELNDNGFFESRLQILAFSIEFVPIGIFEKHLNFATILDFSDTSFNFQEHFDIPLVNGKSIINDYSLYSMLPQW